MKRSLKSLSLISALSVMGAAAAVPTVDGLYDAVYGAPYAIQDTQTEFGDNSSNIAPYAAGSEINGAYAYRTSTDLYLFIPGNLESNFNKITVFIDSIAGGQNRLLLGQPGTDFGAMGRMADDGFGNGLTFDAGFDADFATWATCGGESFTMYCNFAIVGDTTTDLGDAGGLGGLYLGNNPGSGPISGGPGTNLGIEMSLDNSNTAGVESGTGLSTLANTGLGTGFEVKIPLSQIGNPSGAIKVCAFINGSGHDFLSNQIIGPIGGGGNLGEPRNVNFDFISGQNYIVIPVPVKVSGKMDFGIAVLPTTVTVEFREAGTSNPVGSPQSVTVNADGTYEVPAPAMQDLDMSVKPKGYLRKTVNTNTTSGDVLDVDFAVVGGDVDGDNLVTLLDYDVFSAYYDKTSSDSDWNTVGSNGFAPVDADLDYDGGVTLLDYDIFSSGYDQAGDN